MVTLALMVALQGAAKTDLDSLLAAGDLKAARRAAERLVNAYPNDARARLLLGRVWLAWPVVGRYRALEEFRAAERLAPGDPEAPWGQVAVGYRLGSDDGERIAREALLKLFALAPADPEAWARFTELYHNEAGWRRADRAFALHPNDPTALERRALIAIALEQPDRADAFAARVLARRAPHVPAYLVRAAAGFQAGRDAVGYAWYDSALAHADLDSTGALWDNVWFIATPAEAARFAAGDATATRRFFEWFWGKRDPNLVTRENERIAEHFRRLAYVRRQFHLLHPLSLYHRSAIGRALAVAGFRSLQQEFLEGEPTLLPAASADRFALARRLGPDPREAGDAAGNRSPYSLAGLDARGLVWLRQGPPDVRAPGVLDPLRPVDLPAVGPLDAEAWLYYTPDGPASVAFTRATASAGLQIGGDYIFTPMTRRQLQQTRRLLHSDRTTLPAPLAPRVWSAFFRGRTPGRTDVYYRCAPDMAALTLWDELGVAAALARGPGLLRVTAPPGSYAFGLDVDSAGVLGRIRGTLSVPSYARAATPTLSSLVLAAADTLGDRDATLAAMPTDLAYRAGTPLATYAEVYGLAVEQGASRYIARYTFAPVRAFLARALGSGHPVVFELTREGPARGVVVEQLVLEPGRVPPGRYRVTLEVTDAVRAVNSEPVAIEITVR
jgi:hypothetical protein